MELFSQWKLLLVQWLWLVTSWHKLAEQYFGHFWCSACFLKIHQLFSDCESNWGAQERHSPLKCSVLYTRSANEFNPPSFPSLLSIYCCFTQKAYSSNAYTSFDLSSVRYCQVTLENTTFSLLYISSRLPTPYTVWKFSVIDWHFDLFELDFFAFANILGKHFPYHLMSGGWWL